MIVKNTSSGNRDLRSIWQINGGIANDHNNIMTSLWFLFVKVCKVKNVFTYSKFDCFI